MNILDQKEALTSSFGWAWRIDTARGLTSRLNFDDSRQEFFIKVIKLQEGNGAYDASKGAPSTYLRMIAAQCLIRERRSLLFRGRGKVSVGVECDIASESPSGSSEVPMDFHLREREEALDHEKMEKALKVLSDRDRDIVLLRTEGTTFAEIGRLHGISRERTRCVYEESLLKLRATLSRTA